MTTIGQLVTDAYRENNIIPITRTPTTAEMAEAVARMSNIIVSYFGYELGEKLYDWNVPDPQRTAPVSAHYPYTPYTADKPADVYLYPPPNVRIVAKNVSSTTLYLQQDPEDGARLGVVNVGSTAPLTLDGNGRLIENAAAITLDPVANASWFYRADLGGWIKVLAAYGEADESPFPVEYDDLLICDTAIRLGPRYGQEPASGTVARYQMKMAEFKAQYRQHPLVLGSRDELRFPRYPGLGRFGVIDGDGWT